MRLVRPSQSHDHSGKIRRFFLDLSRRIALMTSNAGLCAFTPPNMPAGPRKPTSTVTQNQVLAAARSREGMAGALRCDVVWPCARDAEGSDRLERVCVVLHSLRTAPCTLHPCSHTRARPHAIAPHSTPPSPAPGLAASQIRPQSRWIFSGQRAY